MAVFRKYWLGPEPVSLGWAGQSLRGEQSGVAAQTRTVATQHDILVMRRARASGTPRVPTWLAAAMMAAALCIGVGARPSFAASPGAASSGVPEQSIDDALARQIEVSGENERIPVLVEAAATAPTSVDKVGNQQRAQNAAEVARRSGARVSGQIAMLGAAAAELTPAQVRKVVADGGIARVSLDRPVKAASMQSSADTGTPVVYQSAVGATTARQQGFTGRGVTVAVLDSGIADDPALAGRVTRRVDLVAPMNPVQGDPGGHGTHVAGIVGASSPELTGIAPDARLVSVRVLDGAGNGRLSTVIRGLEWAIAHREEYGIRVVVLALGAPAQESYRTDVLAAAAELAWRAGLVVVTASGNEGPGAGSVSTPGTDPLLITVGASDDGGTASTNDDTLPDWSGRGPTRDGVIKPDLVAPGRKIVSLRVPGSTLDREMPTHIEGLRTFRLSGTSEATAVVAGTAAVLLQQRPELQPDEIKALLVGAARPLVDVDRAAQGAGSVDVARALSVPSPSKAQAQQHVPPALAFMRAVLHHLDDSYLDGALVRAIKTDPRVWAQITADSRLWGLIQADPVLWGRVQATHASWDTLKEDTAFLQALRRNSTVWDAVRSSSAVWEAVIGGTHASWDHASWDHASWDAAVWDALLNEAHASWDHASWDHASWDTSPLD